MKTITTDVLEELHSTNPRVKYVRAKQLLALSRKNPEALYPHFEFFTSLLKDENNILKWTAIDILGSCASVDDQKRIDALLPKFVRFLKAGKLITANHAISALTDMARAKSDLQPRIVRELLKVGAYTYETDECKNIVIGKVIDAMSALPLSSRQMQNAVAFVEKQRENSRSATRKRAEKFLRRRN